MGIRYDRFNIEAVLTGTHDLSFRAKINKNAGHIEMTVNKTHFAVCSILQTLKYKFSFMLF